MQVLASNAIFLGLVALVPFTLGRLVLSIASRLVVATADLGSNAASMASTADPTLVNSRGEIFDGNSTMLNYIVGVGISAGASGGPLWDVGNTIDVVTEAMVSALKLSDAATVAVGYGVILLALSFYLCLIAIIRYTHGQPITVGHIHGVTTMAEAAPSVARQMIAGVRYMATMVKVAFLLVIELGVFPLLCGWWLDVCTLGMLEATISHRVAFFWSSPLTSSLLHWLVGIVYMLQISIFVSLLREVISVFFHLLVLHIFSLHAIFLLMHLTRDTSPPYNGDVISVYFPASGIPNGMCGFVCRCYDQGYCTFYVILLIRIITHFGISLMTLYTSMHVVCFYQLWFMGASLLCWSFCLFSLPYLLHLTCFHLI